MSITDKTCDIWHKAVHEHMPHAINHKCGISVKFDPSEESYRTYSVIGTGLLQIRIKLYLHGRSGCFFWWDETPASNRKEIDTSLESRTLFDLARIQDYIETLWADAWVKAEKEIENAS